MSWYTKKRGWSEFGLVMSFVGMFFVVTAIFLAQYLPQNELLPMVIIFALGVVLTGIGVKVLIWNWKETKKDSYGKVDKTATYVFTLTTEQGSEIVTDYAQMQAALKKVETTLTGKVEVKIEPPMANICVIDCCYRNGYFNTYYLQKRKDGYGYWFSLSDTTDSAAKNLKRLYVKHKNVDFYGLNRKKTGEGR